MTMIWLCHYGAVGVRELSRVSFIRVLIPLMTALPSWPYHLLKLPSPNTSNMLKFQHTNLEKTISLEQETKVKLLAELIPSGDSRGEHIFCPFQLIKATCLLWLMASSLHDSNLLLLSSHLLVVTLTLFFLSYKTIQLIQDDLNLMVLAKFLLPYKLTFMNSTD